MWPYPKVLAHRGGGTLAPENTLAGIRCGLERGFHAVEFDVMLSGDGVPVLMHDDRLGRTVAGCGAISDFTAEELRRMDAGGWFGAQFTGEPVPTLAEAAAFCKLHRIWMNVEIKPASGFDRETGHTVAKLVQHLFESEISARAVGGGVEALPLFSSFSAEALQEARRAAPEIPRGYLVERIPPDWQMRLLELDAVALHVDHRYLSQAQALAVKAAGYGLLCYTVNDVQRARELLAWGVDAFCTDRIDLIDAQF
ncbi:MAG: glycerophosphodiester phosphodiesterase [Burkholderiales bacterium]